MHISPSHILFILLVSMLNSHAVVEVSTMYRWHPENIPGKKFSGKCYEIDMETAGKKYVAPVPASKCRPSEDKLTHIWIPKEGAPGGKCFEVDIDTSGDLYSKFSAWRNCMPPEGAREYVLNEQRCYLVGQFNGAPFIQGVKYKFCKSDEIAYQFMLGDTGTRGSCIEVDKVNQITKSASLSKCRPEGEGATQFIWEPTKAKCYEIAVEGGPQKYISSVDKKKCKPSELSYQWVQSDDPKCLEVGTTKEGLPFRNKVADEKCLEGVAREFQFLKQSPISGTCFEIDRETKGQKVRRIVNAKECRSNVEELEVQIMAYLGKDYCIEFDKSDPTQGYRKSVNKKDCTKQSTKIRWEQDEKNPFEGKCLKLSYYAGAENWSSIHRSKCKTGETIYYWYRPEIYPEKWVKAQRKKKSFSQTLQSILASKDNLVFFGKCYEIDKDKGPSVYSSQTNIKNCKPKELTLRYFHPSEYIKGGCFVVDKKTKGEKYLKKTLDKACKDEFLKTKSQIIEENRDYGPDN